MVGALTEAMDTAKRAGAAKERLGVQLGTALAAVEANLFEGSEVTEGAYKEMAAVIAGYVVEADWGGRRTKGLKAVFEGQIQRVQGAAAHMLAAWGSELRQARKWTQKREKGRGRMGAVFWAWSVVTARNRGRWTPSTRVTAERGESGIDALPAAEGREWAERGGVSALRAGSMWAWLYAWQMWRAPLRTADRVRWAAWRVRMAGRGDWRQRYAMAVAEGARPVSKGYKGKKVRCWAQVCARHVGGEEMSEGVALDLRVDSKRGRLEIRPRRAVSVGWKRVRKAGMPVEGYRVRGASGVLMEGEQERGRKTARQECYKTNRGRQGAKSRRGGSDVSGGGEVMCYWPPPLMAWVEGDGEERGRKRRAPVGWKPEERRAVSRRRLAEQMERARMGAAEEREREREEGRDERDEMEQTWGEEGSEAAGARIDDG